MCHNTPTHHPNLHHSIKKKHKLVINLIFNLVFPNKLENSCDSFEKKKFKLSYKMVIYQKVYLAKTSFIGSNYSCK